MKSSKFNKEFEDSDKVGHDSFGGVYKYYLKYFWLGLHIAFLIL
jgi:hypothetical protein